MRQLSAYLPSPPSTNYHLGQLSVDPYSLLPKDAVVLDVGSGGSHGRYAFVTDPTVLEGKRFIGVDLVLFDDVTVLADGMHLPLKAESIDFLTCVSVLEYIPDPQKLIAEAYRVLKPGGLFYLSAPFVFPYHPPPDDLFRFSFQGLRVLARRFVEIRAGSNRGPASTFALHCVYFLAILLSFNSRRLYGALVYGLTWSLAWIKYLDGWIGRYVMANVLFGNAFFLGQKPSPSGQAASKPSAVGRSLTERVQMSDSEQRSSRISSGP